MSELTTVARPYAKAAFDYAVEANSVDAWHEMLVFAAEVSKDIKEKWEKWFQNYDDRLQKESLNQLQRKEKMDAVNPKYVLRNYMAQLAIDAADNGDYSLINELFQLLKKPYSEQPKYEKWFAKRPEWARNKVGCSMLSCSS